MRRTLNQDLAEEYCEPKVTPCSVFTEGQEFIYDVNIGERPAKFCDNAWNDIYKVMMTLALKGNFQGWMKKDGTNISCCTDGIRPVIFKIERIED